MLIDHIFNKQTNESAYGPAAGVETIKQLIKSVQTKKDIDLSVGPEQFPVRYDEARYLLSLWRANMEGGDKTADLFGDVNWVQSKLDDRDYRMGAGKLKDIDQERMKDIQKDKVLNLEYDSHNVGAGQYSDFEVMQAIKIAQDNEDNMTGAIEKIEAIKPGLSDHRAVKHELQKVNENCGKCPVTGEDECHCDDGVDKEKETEFHKKLDDLVHSTFGKRKDENVEEGLEDVKPTDEEARQILNMLRVFFDDQEGYQDAVAIDAVDYLTRKGLLKDFIKTLPYFDEDYEEFLDSYDKDFLEKRFGIKEDSDRPPATQDYITKTIAKKIKPGLDPDGEEFEDQAYLYHTSQLGRQNLLAKGGNWKAYYDAIKWWYKNMNESVEEGLMLSPKMEYKGWTYTKDVEEYEDNRKIFHSATKDGKEVSMDWSPYSTPTEKEFKLWIDLGMPTRKDVNSIGPLDNDDLMTLAKTKRGTAGLLQQEDKEDPIDQSKLDAKTKVALKKAGLKYGAQTKGDPLASLVTFVADKDSEKTQDIDRLDQENDKEEADIKAQDLVDKEHTKKLGNNDLQDKYQDQEIERLKQDLQKLLAR